MRLPSVWGALFEGRIDLPRARVLCEETAHLEDDEAADVVAAIVGEASRLTTVQLGRRLRRMVAERDPGAAKKRYDRGVRERRVESGSNPDGTAELWGRQLPADRAAAAWSRITALARSLRKMGDERSLDQIRADVFLDLLNGNPTHVSSGKGGVRLTVDLTTLMGLADGAGEIEGRGPVVADLARRSAEAKTDGTWEATVTDPEMGQPIWAGTTRRRPSTSQRRHVAARNPTCVFPGCTRSAVECHLDHTVAFSESRRTTVLNLGPLCARHHLRAKHRAGWKLTQPQPGTFCWTSPAGSATSSAHRGADSRRVDGDTLRHWREEVGMAFIDTIPEERAEAQVADMYRRVRESIGYVPNYAKVFSHRPALFDAWAQLNGTVKNA